MILTWYLLILHLEVAQERNKNRDRVLSDERLATSWKDVQANLGKFQNLIRWITLEL